jgi:DNA-binding protein H-NS
VQRRVGAPAWDFHSRIPLESRRVIFGTEQRIEGTDMASLQDLLDRKAELEREIEATRRQERADAISKVKALMSEYGLTMADLASKGGTPKSPGGAGRGGGKVAVKYRNAATGDTWSGRGLQPKWLKAALAAGRKIDEFDVR